MTKERIGWIGTGVMGAAMAKRLLDAGYALTVYNRTKSKAELLLDAGAEWAGDPRATAGASDIVISIVGYPRDVEEVYLGEVGVLSADDLPRIVIDMTTSSPDLATRIAAEAQRKGVHSIDAPVSGGDVGAKNGTLSIMMGGDESAIETVRPILEYLGQRITRLGGPGSGQHTKMVNQILISTMMIGACEGLMYAGHAGLDLKKVIEAVGSGAAGSWTINNLGPRIADRNFEPGFYVEHFIKDMNIALAEGRRMNLSMPGLALAEQLYEAVQAQGYGRKGTHALMLALESLSGVHVSD